MNLRFRFILSNVLPLFIVLPLMGLLSIYIFERRILIPQQSQELKADLDLLQHLSLEYPDLFNDSDEAQAYTQRYTTPQINWRLMIFDAGGRILASSDPGDQARMGQEIDRPEFQQSIAQNEVILTNQSSSLESEAIDIWSSVRGPDGQLLGVLRVTQPLASIADDLMRVRGYMLIILGVGLVVGTLIGMGLAISMERPLNNMTQALRAMAWEENPSPIQLDGPEEITTLASTFTHLVERIDEEQNARKKLLANLVHELGRPLGALRAALHALSAGAYQDPELRQELLSGMDTQTSDLARLVEDLTHLYDESFGRFELKQETVPMEAWLRQSVATWKAHADQKSVHLQLEIKGACNLYIDANRMNQALGNLLSNAIKFTPKNGKVQVRAFMQDRQAVLQVEDSGPGLTPADRAHLFSPFYRGEQGTRFPKGMGIGLSIAHDIIDAHNGSLEVSSELKAGTQFTIRLPIASD